MNKGINGKERVNLENLVIHKSVLNDLRSKENILFADVLKYSNKNLYPDLSKEDLISIFRQAVEERMPIKSGDELPELDKNLVQLGDDLISLGYGRAVGHYQLIFTDYHKYARSGDSNSNKIELIEEFRALKEVKLEDVVELNNFSLSHNGHFSLSQHEVGNLVRESIEDKKQKIPSFNDLLRYSNGNSHLDLSKKSQIFALTHIANERMPPKKDDESREFDKDLIQLCDNLICLGYGGAVDYKILIKTDFFDCVTNNKDTKVEVIKDFRTLEKVNLENVKKLNDSSLNHDEVRSLVRESIKDEKHKFELADLVQQNLGYVLNQDEFEQNDTHNNNDNSNNNTNDTTPVSIPKEDFSIRIPAFNSTKIKPECVIKEESITTGKEVEIYSKFETKISDALLSKPSVAYARIPLISKVPDEITRELKSYSAKLSLKKDSFDRIRNNSTIITNPNMFMSGISESRYIPKFGILANETFEFEDRDVVQNKLDSSIDSFLLPVLLKDVNIKHTNNKLYSIDLVENNDANTNNHNSKDAVSYTESSNIDIDTKYDLDTSRSDIFSSIQMSMPHNDFSIKISSDLERESSEHVEDINKASDVSYLPSTQNALDQLGVLPITSLDDSDINKDSTHQYNPEIADVSISTKLKQNNPVAESLVGKMSLPRKKEKIKLILSSEIKERKNDDLGSVHVIYDADNKEKSKEISKDKFESDSVIKHEKATLQELANSDSDIKRLNVDHEDMGIVYQESNEIRQDELAYTKIEIDTFKQSPVNEFSYKDISIERKQNFKNPDIPKSIKDKLSIPHDSLPLELEPFVKGSNPVSSNGCTPSLEVLLSKDFTPETIYVHDTTKINGTDFNDSITEKLSIESKPMEILSDISDNIQQEKLEYSKIANATNEENTASYDSFAIKAKSIPSKIDFRDIKNTKSLVERLKNKREHFYIEKPEWFNREKADSIEIDRDYSVPTLRKNKDVSQNFSSYIQNLIESYSANTKNYIGRKISYAKSSLHSIVDIILGFKENMSSVSKNVTNVISKKVKNLKDYSINLTRPVKIATISSLALLSIIGYGVYGTTDGIDTSIEPNKTHKTTSSDLKGTYSSFKPLPDDIIVTPVIKPIIKFNIESEVKSNSLSGVISNDDVYSLLIPTGNNSNNNSSNVSNPKDSNASYTASLQRLESKSKTKRETSYDSVDLNQSLSEISIPIIEKNNVNIAKDDVALPSHTTLEEDITNFSSSHNGYTPSMIKPVLRDMKSRKIDNLNLLLKTDELSNKFNGQNIDIERIINRDLNLLSDPFTDTKKIDYNNPKENISSDDTKNANETNKYEVSGDSKIKINIPSPKKNKRRGLAGVLDKMKFDFPSFNKLSRFFSRRRRSKRDNKEESYVETKVRYKKDTVVIKYKTRLEGEQVRQVVEKCVQDAGFLPLDSSDSYAYKRLTNKLIKSVLKKNKKLKNRNSKIKKGKTLEIIISKNDLKGRNDNLRSIVQAVPTGRIVSSYGMRKHPISGKYRHHNGLDIAAPYNTPIKSVSPGKVISKGWRRGYGRTVIVRYNEDLTIRYAHMNGYSGKIKVGQKIKKNTKLGRVGSSGASKGPHLHLEMRIKGKHVNPKDYLLAFSMNKGLGNLVANHYQKLELEKTVKNKKNTKNKKSNNYRRANRTKSLSKKQKAIQNKSIESLLSNADLPKDWRLGSNILSGQKNIKAVNPDFKAGVPEYMMDGMHTITNVKTVKCFTPVYSSNNINHRELRREGSALIIDQNGSTYVMDGNKRKYKTTSQNVRGITKGDISLLAGRTIIVPKRMAGKSIYVDYGKGHYFTGWYKGEHSKKDIKGNSIGIYVGLGAKVYNNSNIAIPDRAKRIVWYEGGQVRAQNGNGYAKK